MIKIIDVGISRKSRPSYRGEIQTREYRAPEVLTGELGRKYNLTEVNFLFCLLMIMMILINELSFETRAQLATVSQNYQRLKNTSDLQIFYVVFL